MIENNLEVNKCVASASSEMINTVNNLIDIINKQKNTPIAIMPLTINNIVSDVIASIATNIANYSRKVILIDAVTDASGKVCTDSATGLYEYVVMNEDLDKCIVKSEDLAYDTMYSGNILNGIELAHHDDFDKRINELYQFYDVVLVLVSRASDSVTASIANKIGQTMIIIDKSIDNKRDLISTRDSLENFIGAVVLKSVTRTFKQWLNTKSK